MVNYVYNYKVVNINLLYKYKFMKLVNNILVYILI